MSDLPTTHSNTAKIPLDWRELSTDGDGNLRESSNDPKPPVSVQTPMYMDMRSPIQKLGGQAPKYKEIK